MEKKQIQKAARPRKALPQQTAKREDELAQASVPPERDPMHIFKNERGELAISQAGSIKVTQTFLGTNAPAGKDNTTLDNHR